MKSDPRWKIIIAEELRKKGADRLDIPGYEKILLIAIRDILTAERQHLSSGGFPIQQNTNRIINSVAERLEQVEQEII